MHPTDRPRWPGYLVVAYSLGGRRDDAGLYRRRVWFRKPQDPAVYGPDDWPIEAVHPTSIAPGRPSRPMGTPARWRSA